VDKVVFVAESPFKLARKLSVPITAEDNYSKVDV
jgi:hypothetical protein